MNRQHSILTLAALMLLALPAHRVRAAEPVLAFVVSIYPLEMLLSELTGGRAEITTLVPSGASPHTFEPKPSDLARVARADGFIRVGGGLDDWTQRILANTGSKIPQKSLEDWLASTPDRPWRSQAEHDSHAHNRSQGAPHSWLDPILVRDRIVPAMVDSLIALDPAGRAVYQARSEDFRARLTALDAEIRRTLGQAAGREFVAFHNAWRHFANRYGLRELAVVQEFAGEEPTPRELARLVEAARRANLHAILVEPQLDVRLARTIGLEFGARTVLVDPLGDADRDDRAHYEALMRFNATAFSRALGGINKGMEH